MKHKLHTVVMSLALVLAACEAPPPTIEHTPSEALDALAQAHEAYLEADWLRMTQSLRDVLGSDRLDAATRQNAIELLDKAFEVNGGKLPADWRLPKAVRRLTLVQVRVDVGERAHYRVLLHGSAATVDAVVGLRLSQGGSTLIDKTAGAGAWAVTKEDHGFYFELESDPRDEPLAHGLYEVVVQTADEEVTGWVLASRLRAGAVPQVSAPIHGQVFGEARPTFRWTDFRSPEHQPFDKRTLSLWLAAEGDNAKQKPTWSLWTAKPQRTEATPDVLADGRYWLAVTFTERRQFGAVQLSRGARRVLPFSVQQP